MYDKSPLVEHVYKLLFQETRKNLAQLFLFYMRIFYTVFSKSEAKLNLQ